MNGLISKVFAQDGQTINIDRLKAGDNLIRINNIGTVISSAVGILLIISAILAFLFLVLGGIQWITSGGDKAGMEAARNKITHAIVGLVIVASAWAIMLLVQSFLGISILDNPNLKLPPAYQQ